MDKRASGRPGIISEDIVKRILSAIQAGNYMEAAASYAGISKDTLYRWLKRGARELERVSKHHRSKIKTSEALYCELSDGIEKAAADSEVRDVSMISKAAAGANTITETQEFYDEKGTLVKKVSVTRQAGPQWQAAAWRLERKYPNRWGRNMAVFAPQDIPALIVEEVPMDYGMNKNESGDDDDDDVDTGNKGD